jgi:hypothetical protein
MPLFTPQIPHEFASDRNQNSAVTDRRLQSYRSVKVGTGVQLLGVSRDLVQHVCRV